MGCCENGASLSLKRRRQPRIETLVVGVHAEDGDLLQNPLVARLLIIHLPTAGHGPIQGVFLHAVNFQRDRDERFCLHAVEAQDGDGFDLVPIDGGLHAGKDEVSVPFEDPRWTAQRRVRIQQ